MVQEFHVLRCFACQTFQVQQVKKAKKWSCKLCGEKQSVIKEYGRGTGADCRRHVQKLNGLRGQLLQEEDEGAWSRWEEDGDEVSEFNHEDQDLSSNPQQDIGGSRWNKYVDTAMPSEDVEDHDENVYTESTRFVSHRNIRKRKRGGRGRFGASGYDDGGADEEDQGQESSSWRGHRGSWKRKRGGRGRFGGGGYGNAEGEEEEDQGQESGSWRGGSWRGQQGSWKKKRGGQGRFGAGGYGNAEGEEEEDQGQESGSWRSHRGSWKQRARSRPVHPAAVTTEDCTFSTPSFHTNTPTPSAASKAPPSQIPSRLFHHSQQQQQHRPTQPSRVTADFSASRPSGPPTHRTPLADTPINKATSVSSLLPVAKVCQPESKSSSKWAKFLTVASVEDQEERGEEEDGDGAGQWSDLDEASDETSSWSVAFHNPAAPPPPTAAAKALPANFRADKHEKTCSNGLLFGSVPSLAKASGVADKMKSAAAACFGFASVASQIPSPTFTTKPFRQEGGVNQQPQPSKRPCTGLGVSSLFQTDEDFDVAF